MNDLWVGPDPAPWAPGAQGPTSRSLLERLRTMGLELPEDALLLRTYASRADRSNGAWSWFAVDHRRRELRVGSQLPMRQLLRADRLAATRTPDGDVDVEPAPADTADEPGGRWVRSRHEPYLDTLYEACQTR